MSSSSYYAIFCALSVVVLKELNGIVDAPYMVSAARDLLHTANRSRTSHSTSHRRRRTAGANSTSGTRKSQRRLGCTCMQPGESTLTRRQLYPLVYSQKVLHVQMHPADAQTNSDVVFAGTSVGVDPALGVPQTSVTPGIDPGALRRSRRPRMLPSRLVLWLSVLYRGTECALRGLHGCCFIPGRSLARCSGKSSITWSKYSRCVTSFFQLGSISCTFRQTNIVWVLYAYGSSQLMWLRFRRGGEKLHDPPALEARPGECLVVLEARRN